MPYGKRLWNVHPCVTLDLEYYTTEQDETSQQGTTRVGEKSDGVRFSIFDLYDVEVDVYVNYAFNANQHKTSRNFTSRLKLT